METLVKNNEKFELLILDIQIKMETTKLYETWKQTTPVMRQDD